MINPTFYKTFPQNCKDHFLNGIWTHQPSRINSFTEFMYNVSYFAKQISKMDDDSELQNENLTSGLYSAYQQASSSLQNSNDDKPSSSSSSKEKEIKDIESSKTSNKSQKNHPTMADPKLNPSNENVLLKVYSLQFIISMSIF